ncbi:hypothetical protein [Paenibacillus terrigena]|uniref:hypothetical protein n=1 Tax=Paenibacillus terrigena TaxID=369333 RepID=UPI0003670DEB|nr:hypothetical protein [Paenibacillus terrigena]
MYVYALINERNEVLEIKETEIQNSNESMRVVQVTGFKEGDEINFYLIINDINEDGIVTSYSGVKQNPYVKELLTKNAELRAKQDLMQTAMDDLILGGVL